MIAVFRILLAEVRLSPRSQLSRDIMTRTLSIAEGSLLPGASPARLPSLQQLLPLRLVHLAIIVVCIVVGGNP